MKSWHSEIIELDERDVEEAISDFLVKKTGMTYMAAGCMRKKFSKKCFIANSDDNETFDMTDLNVVCMYTREDVK